MKKIEPVVATSRPKRLNNQSATSALDFRALGRIVNALDKKANKGTDVPLVSRSLTFTFTGLDVAGASSAPLQVTGLRLQFGSNMSEPALLSGNAIPEPTAIGLLSLTSMALLRRRR